MQACSAKRWVIAQADLSEETSTMKKLVIGILVVLAILFLVVQCSRFTIFKRSFSETTEERAVSSFHKLDIETAGKVYITQGDTESVVVVANKRLQNNIKTQVSGNTLFIEMDLGWFDRYILDRSTVEIYITVRDLQEFTFEGVGVVKGEDLHLDSLELDFKGVGDFTLTGSVGSLDVESEGVGKLDLSDFTGEHVSLEQTGIGDVSLSANQSLTIRATGIGKVTYRGDVAEDDVTIRSSGIGGVTRR